MTKIISFLLIITLTGCSYVTSQNPVGLENYPLKTDDWNGTWLNEDGTVKINVIDESTGIIEIAWIEKKEKELKFESVKAKIMKGNKWLYANILDNSNNQQDNHYFWIKLKKEKNKVILWHPSVAAFKEAVDKNKIKAIINKNRTIDGTREITESIKLIDTSKNIVNLLENSGSEYFIWDEPLILIKLKD